MISTHERLDGFVRGLLVVAVVLGGVFPLVSVASSGQAPAVEGSLTPDGQSAEANVTSGTIRWANQTLFFRARDPEGAAGDIYGIRRFVDGEVGLILTEFVLDERGEAVLRTGSIPPGRYVIVNQDGEPVRVGSDGVSRGSTTAENASWELAAQTLRLEAASRQVLQKETARLLINSNRGRYPVIVSSPDTDVETLAELIGGTSVDTEDDGVADAVRTTATAMETRPISIPDDMPPGTYRLKFTVPDTDVTDNTTIRVREEPRVTASFASLGIQADRGEVARFGLTLDHTRTATVWVGSRAQDYLTRLRVVDGNNDGRVSIRMNTYYAGRVPRADEGDIYTTGDRADKILNVSRHTKRRDDPLAVGEYPLNTTVEGRTTHTATLFVANRSTGHSIDILTAPSRARTDTINTLRDVTSSRDRIALDDKLVLRVETTGLSGFFNDSYDLARGSADARRHGVFMTITPRNKSGQSHRLDMSSADLFLTDDIDTIYAVLDTSDLDVRTGETYRAQFVISDTSPLVSSGEREETSTSFTVVERRATFDDRRNDVNEIRKNISAGGGRMIGFPGSSTVAPGTKLLVTLRSNDPFFFRNQTVTVQENGEWFVEFRFGAAELTQDRSYVMKIRDGAAVISDRVTLVPVQPTETPTSTLTPRSDDSDSGGLLDIKVISLALLLFVVVGSRRVQGLMVRGYRRLRGLVVRGYRQLRGSRSE